MDQEVQYLKKHFMDLSRRADNKHLVTFSNFLDLNGLNIFHQIEKELYTSFEIFGGYSYAERQMVAFIPDALFSWDYPICAIRISPSHPRFAETLTHRDVLGALMGLGIKREMLGDILVRDTEVIVLCVDIICGHLIDNCIKIRNTMVHCEQISMEDLAYEPNFVEKDSIVSSLRLDAVIADVCRLPRSTAKKLILEGDSFVNSRKIQRNDHICQDGDILSVRHYGKFVIETTDTVTRKGKIKYKYKIYS